MSPSQTDQNESESDDEYCKVLVFDPHLRRVMTKSFTSHCMFCIYKNYGCVVPAYFDYRRIRNFRVRPDDVWVITFPRSGATWTQEMVWLLANDMNFEKAKQILQTKRFHYLEDATFFNTTYVPGNSLEILENLESPRFIKSHLSFGMLPKELFTVKPKIIYLYRNPKDVAISNYHLFRLRNGYTGSLEDYLESFLQDRVSFCPYWPTVLQFWKMRNEPNILFITYEEMSKDIVGVAERTAKFLGVDIPDNLREEFFRHISFDSMKVNTSVYMEEEMENCPNKTDFNLIGRGKSGGWRDELPANFVDRFDKKAREALEGSDFPWYQ